MRLMPRLPSLSLWSEAFPPTGGISARGVQNALGRPGLELSTLLLRETVQNTWDARDAKRRGPVRYGAHHRTLSGRELAALKGLFHQVPGASLSLGTLLHANRIRTLTIFDRGTIGLAGPTRADLAASGPKNFVSFVRNVGYSEQRKLAGGTYGYGKSVLYRASEAGTILIHTRCRSEKGALVSRLIGAALGQLFESRGLRFTGRHWWGVHDPKVGVEPITGDAADRLAASVGMPAFGPAELGTSIMIIGAAFGEAPRKAMVEMAEATLWHCWPKIVALDHRDPDMAFDIRCDGEELPIDRPDKHVELRYFVHALKDVLARRHSKKSDNPWVYEIESLRPRQLLGHVAYRTYPTPSQVSENSGRPFDPPSRHVALLRHPRLVVSYAPGPEIPLGFSWAGVFLASSDVDEAFAESEPPSHDSWSYAALPQGSWNRRYVKIALDRLEDLSRKLAIPAPPPGGSSQPLGQLADDLGGLLVYSSATSGGTRIRDKAKEREPKRRSPKGDRKGRSRIDLGQPRLAPYRGAMAMQVPFIVWPTRGQERCVVEAHAAVAINDGTSMETDPPEGADIPRILEWTVGGAQQPASRTVTLTGEGPHECSVLVSVPADVAVMVDVHEAATS